MTDVVFADMHERLVLRAVKLLGLDPGTPETQALMLVANRYQLDPCPGIAEVALIGTKQGFKAYVTLDGYIKLAHRSGDLDGIVTELAERTENGGHRARVAVYRKGMTHPFTRVGGCGHDEPMSRQGHGETMAFARACRRALRLAFPPDHVGLDGADLEPGDDGDTIHVVNEAAELAPEPPVSSYRPTTDDQRRARQILYARTEGEVAAFMTRHGIRDRGKAPFPADAVAELLEEPF